MTRHDIYEGTSIYILSFSFDQPDSLENLRLKWYPEIQKQQRASENLPMLLLLGLKSDLIDDINISQGEVEKKALLMVMDLECFNYVRCSSKTSKGLEDSTKQIYEIVDFCFEEIYSKERKKKQGFITGLLSKLLRANDGKEEEEASSVFSYDESYNKSRAKCLGEEKLEKLKFLKDQEIRTTRLEIEKDLEEARRIRKTYHLSSLSYDVVRFLLNSFVLLNHERDCYEGKYLFHPSTSLIQYFGYFTTDQNRNIFQVFYNFELRSWNQLLPTQLPIRIQYLTYTEKPRQTVYMRNRTSSKNRTELISTNIYRKNKLGGVPLFHEVRNIHFPFEYQYLSRSEDGGIDGIFEDLRAIKDLFFVRSDMALKDDVLDFIDTLNNHNDRSKNLEVLEIRYRKIDERYWDLYYLKETKNPGPLCLSSLKKLRIYSSKLLIDEFDFSAKHVPNLEVLELSFKFEGGLYVEEEEMKKRKKISKKQFGNICQLPCLKELVMMRVGLSDINESLIQERFLQQNEKIEVFVLRNCRFSFNNAFGVELSCFEGLENLRVLEIADCDEEKGCPMNIFPKHFVARLLRFVEEKGNVIDYKLKTFTQNFSR